MREISTARSLPIALTLGLCLSLAATGAVAADGAANAGAAAPSAAAAQREFGPQVQPYITVNAAEVVLDNVRIIDGTGAPAMEDRAILIRDGEIAEIGAAGSITAGPDAELLDLSGHTVIPGLVGLHNHSYYTTRRRSVQLSYSGPRLYLGAGVTTVRTTGSNAPYEELNMARAIEEGRVPGPTVYVTGPYLTGQRSGAMQMAHLSGPESAARLVEYWTGEGVTWFKAYTDISRDELRAAIEAAHRNGAKVTAHLCSVSFREAVSLGIDNLEHGLLANSDYDDTREPDVCSPNLMRSALELDLDSELVQETFEEMMLAGVGMTSTPVVYEMFVNGRPPIDQRTLDALAPAAREEVMAARTQMEEAGQGIPAELFQKALQYDYRFFAAGGVLAAGVDPTGYGAALPGFGDQRNFELLMETDFSPEEAIQVVSANGAKILGIYDRVGSIETGKQADLVVLSANPAADPSAIRTVTLVFKEGVGYDSAALIEAVQGQVGIR